VLVAYTGDPSINNSWLFLLTVITDTRETWIVDLVRISKWVFWMFVKPVKEAITIYRNV
jgi:hypothetical protein